MKITFKRGEVSLPIRKWMIILLTIIIGGALFFMIRSIGNAVLP